jgi:O-antigen ligase
LLDKDSNAPVLGVPLTVQVGRNRTRTARTEGPVAASRAELLGRQRRIAVRGGFAVDSSASLSQLGRAVVLIRKKIQGRIVNGWLVIIMVLGALITVADGLTRPALDPNGALLPPFDYEPQHGAFLLAVVTLPLMFAYAKKARVPLAEGLFLWFTFCTVTYMRDFAYLRLPGVPFFVTEAALVAILLSIYVLPGPHYSHNPLAINLFFGFLITAGVVSTLRGFSGHRESILVLRDSAMTAYALFLAAGYHLFRSWLSIKRWALWFLLGTALSVLNGLSWFLRAPEQWRFIFPGIYVLASLIIVLVMFSNHIILPIVGWIFVGVFSLGLLLANARSLFVSLAVVFVMVLLVPKFLRGKSRLVSSVVTLIVAAVLSCSLAFGLFRERVGRDFTIRVANDLASGVLHSGEDPYWQFRLLAWKEAWKRFEEYPPAGEGFGIPFAFEIWDNDARPHNTFLTVLYKMGLLGGIPLFAFLGYFFWRVYAALRRHHRKGRVLFLQVGCAVQVCFCLYGMANLALESPHLASIFWAAMGVDLRMIRMLDLEQSLRKRANASRIIRPLTEGGPAGQETEHSE